MKILYHHRTLADGAEGIHVSAMVDAFQRLGHEVKVAALIGEQTHISTPCTQVLEYLTRRSPRLAYETMEIGYNLLGYRMLMHHIRRWNPDVVYERYTLFNTAGLAATRRTGLPLVLEINSPLAYERATYEQLALQRIAHGFERFVCSRADVPIVVSTPLKNYLVAQGVPQGRLTVVPNGADPEVFHPSMAARQAVRAQLGIPPDSVVVGFVGILRPWHGVELLVEAVARIKATRESLHVLIVGDGPSRPHLEQLTASRGLQDLVTFTGRVPHREIPRYVAAFDIAVSPRATFYASPMKVPEYMAAGVVVLAPRMVNLEDLLTEGVDGILFEPENIDDMAAQLDSLRHDPDQRRQLGRGARATVLASHTWQQNAEQILKLVSNRRV
jgi:glycosyltransferase involved in cell wall biosynthesis